MHAFRSQRTRFVATAAQPRSTRRTRRGALVVLVALLLVGIFAVVALCIDIGWTTLTKSELQTAADAAAAAGVTQLSANYGAYSIPSQTNRSGLIASATQGAKSYATQYGGYNNAGGVASLAILPADIQVGFTDASGNFQLNYAGYPNTLKVIARRDASANSPLPLYFAPVLGMKTTSLTASASATIYTGLISSFDPNGGGVSSGSTFSAGDGVYGEGYGSAGAGFACGLMPVAFDVNTWKSFCASGVSPDGATHTDSTGTPQIQIYPTPQNSPGNFGLLCIGPDTNSDPAYSNWIQNGPSASDLQTLLDAGKLPVSEQSPKNFKGSPGLKSNLGSDFAAIIGQRRLLPLFAPASQSPYQAASGNGNNATYSIVGFVGVMVTQASGNGNNLSISVTPCDVIDPTAVFDPSSVYPAGAAPASQLKTFTHVAPRFTQ